MRRAVGIGRLRKQQEDRQALSQRGSELTQLEINKLQQQLKQMKHNLEEFVTHHNKEIRSNPTLRQQIQRLCQLLGVDPLASRKGYMAELLGVGDFYCELGIQIIDICVGTRLLNGGLIDMEELRQRLVRRRLKTSDHIVRDDIKRAIQQLGPLGGGYQIVEFGDRQMVQSVAREMNPDITTVLTLAQHTSKFTLADIRVAWPGWDAHRINNCVQEMLQAGVVWVEDDYERVYWVPSFFLCK